MMTMMEMTMTRMKMMTMTAGPWRVPGGSLEGPWRVLMSPRGCIEMANRVLWKHVVF